MKSEEVMKIFACGENQPNLFTIHFYLLLQILRKGNLLMAKTKYKKQYAEDLLRYFFKFIEMRDNPKDGDAAERSDLLLMEPGVDGVYKTIPPKPATGYPTLTKFAIMKGVTIQTLGNWRKKYKEFDEACAFADAIQDDILNERALFGTVDGKVAMKIRELKAAAKATEDSNTAVKVIFDIKDDREGERITIKQWDGEVNEDRDY